MNEPFPKPESIGPYLIEAQIGLGACGVVFRGRHCENGEVVAIKVFTNLTLDEDGLPAEVVRLEELDHPAIPKYRGTLELYEHPCLVMDFVDGLPLSEILAEDQPLAIEQAVSLVRQAAEAMQHVHAHKIMHLDIKPSNLIVRPDGRLGIVDFGESVTIQQLSRNRDRRFGGTPRYASPELCRGEIDTFTPVADIYSLGAVCYELVVGHAPYSDSQGAAFMERATSSAVSQKWLLAAHRFIGTTGLAAVDTFVPAARPLREVLARALELDPRKRFQSMAEFADALKVIEGELAGSDYLVGRSAREKKSRRNHSPTAIAAVIVGVVSVVAALLFWVSARRPNLVEKPKTVMDFVADSNLEMWRVARIVWGDHPQNPETAWRFEQGVLVGEGKRSCLLVRTPPAHDFEAEMEFRVNPTGNGGLVFGYDMDRYLEADLHDGSAGEIAITTVHGSGYVLGGNHPIPDEWATLRVVRSGRRVQVLLNGVLITNEDFLREDLPGMGQIGLSLWDGETRLEVRRFAVKFPNNEFAERTQ